MKVVRVREIMTSSVQTMSAHTSIEEAARLLTSRHISGTPVLDGGRVVGVVSKSDLLDPDNRRDERRTVGDVMTTVVYAVRPSDPVMLAVRLMAEEGIHRAVVVGEDGQLAGMITPLDVLKALAHGARIQDGDIDAAETHAEPAIAVPYVDLRLVGISRE